MPVETRLGKRLSEGNVSDSPPKRKPEVKRLKNITNFKSVKKAENDETNIPLPPKIETKQLLVDPSNETIRMMKSIIKILSENFNDIDRLKLYIPLHYRDPESFILLTSNKVKVKQASFQSISMAKSYLVEDSHVHFIHHVSQNCSRREFAGAETIYGILEMILKISPLETHKTIIPASQVLVDLHSLFLRIISMFPVNQSQLSSFLKVLQIPFKIDGIVVEEPTLGIFHAMLALLTELIEDKEAVEIKSRDSDQGDSAFNFYTWELNHKQEAAFGNFTREQKFERIFLVIDLLTHLFENNLAMFVTRNYRKLRKSFDDSRPLICSVLWKSHENLGIINSTVKRIINIFVNSIVLKFPNDNIRILSRLLNVVSQVLNLHEYPDGIHEYPIYKSISINLVQEIKKTVNKSANYQIDLIVRVVENLRSPLMRMLLAHEALQNIQNSSNQISLEVCFDFIKKRLFEKFSTPTSTLLYDSKYPSLNNRQRQSTAKDNLSRDGIMKLLSFYIDAFDTFYCIKRIFREFQSDSTAVAPPNDQTTSKVSFSSFDNINLDEQVSLRQVNQTLMKHNGIKCSKNDFSFYRNEMKYLLLLEKVIK